MPFFILHGDITSLKVEAIGDSFHHISNIHKYAGAEDVPAHTLFVITTDGMENASRTYSAREIKRRIEQQKEEFGWEFLFVGANIDAVKSAGRFGIAPDRAVTYHADRKGTRVVYECLNRAVGSFRANAPAEVDWSDEIAADFNRRTHC